MPRSSRSPSPRRSERADEYEERKRKRSTSPQPRDRSNSPPTQRRRSRSPPQQPPRRNGADQVDLNLPRVRDIDPFRRRERERQLAERMLEEQAAGTGGPAADGAAEGAVVQKSTFDAQAEFAKLLSTRSGGAYMPPSRLRALQQEMASDKTSVEWQRMTWDALRKSINGLINKVNVGNIKYIVPELFNENLIRGRGLFARSIMKAQASSLPFTPVFAALIAIVNTKLPVVGELVLVRLVSQFRRAFKRDDKPVCIATSTFIAHLCNQNVAHDTLALQVLFLLLGKPTDDSVEIAIGFTRAVGAFLTESNSRGITLVFERFRDILHEGQLDKRTQYMIEVLFQVRKDRFRDDPAVPEGLDLVEDDDQITHETNLDDELKVEDTLNVFKPDPKFAENEARYADIKNEILGSSDDEDGSEGSDDESDEEDDQAAPELEGIQDMTETDLINLRRTIYLTLMNSLGFEEAVHKLMKIEVPEGKEIEMCNMIIECCSQERSYTQFYGLIAERFCKLNRIWRDAFQEAFGNYYETIHRYETNKLRNIGRLFGHLLASDAISWAVLHVVHMNEEETTSSSRILIKILMQEIQEEIGMKKMVAIFKDEDLKPALAGIFPTDNPKNTRFSINYFTSIGLGAVTEDMRTWLQNAPKLLMAQRQAQLEAESSDSDSSSDSDTSSDSDSSSDISTSSSSSYSSRGRRSPSYDRRDRRDHGRRRSPSYDRRDSREQRYRSPSYDRKKPRYRSPSSDRSDRKDRRARSPSYDRRDRRERRYRSPSYDDRDRRDRR